MIVLSLLINPCGSSVSPDLLGSAETGDVDVDVLERDLHEEDEEEDDEDEDAIRESSEALIGPYVELTNVGAFVIAEEDEDATGCVTLEED